MMPSIGLVATMPNPRHLHVRHAHALEAVGDVDLRRHGERAVAVGEDMVPLCGSTLAVNVCIEPLRQTPTFTWRPMGVSRTRRDNCSPPSTGWPLYSSTTSPSLMPALAAGLFSSTWVISTPRTSFRLSFFALSASISLTPMPRYGALRRSRPRRARGRDRRGLRERAGHNQGRRQNCRADCQIDFHDP